MSRSAVPARRRLLTAVAAATVTLPLLAACGATGPSSVSTLEGVKSATMRFEGQGTFLEPLTTSPSEFAWVGTGWFIAADGTAVTNNHVVSGAGTLQVAIGGDNSDMYPARVVAASECYDLAVVKVDVPRPVSFLSWFEGDIVEGAEVYSAGYPAALGDDYTLTKGIVSQADTEVNTSFADVTSAIEHDARIRGGNSGGPLVDGTGRVYGVNYAGEDVNDTNAAIGRDDAKGVVDQLRQGQDVLSLGLNIRALAPDESGAPYGIWVQSVRPGSPADAAGMRAGDVLVTLNGVTLGVDGAVAGYCDVLRTSGLEATLDMEVYRTTTGESLEGQINGRALEVVGGGTVPDEVTPTTGGYVDVTSDDGRFTVRVPDSWSEVTTSAVEGGGYQFIASPNAAAFGSDFSVSGITMLGYPGSTTPADGLALFDDGLAGQCTPVEQAVDYADGAFTGLYSYWTGCGGADVAVISANKDDGSAFLLLYAVVNGNEKDDETIGNIAATFNVAL
ncbi:trypsin-like peptidase domain-containing protein [Pseudolysinimonas sp.]